MTTGEDLSSTQTMKIEVKTQGCQILHLQDGNPKEQEPRAASDESTAYSPFLITQSKAGFLHHGTTDI